MPGAVIVKWIAPALLWLAWAAWTALITLPLAIALALVLTIADWLIIRPAVLVLVAAGWTPPVVISDSINQLLDNPPTPAPPETPAPSSSCGAEQDRRATAGAGGSIDAVLDDDDAVLKPYRAEMRAQALIHDKAAEANRLGLELLRQQANQTPPPPAAQPTPPQPAHTMSGRRRRPYGIAARGTLLALWLAAIALTAGGCLTIIGLTTASTTGLTPDPPTPDQLDHHINTTHTERHNTARQQLCDTYPTSPGCQPTNQDPTND